MIHGTWYMMHHASCIMYHARCTMHDAWHMTHDTWCNECNMIHDTWYMLHDMWYMIHDTWYMIHDTWYMIHDTWYMILVSLSPVLHVEGFLNTQRLRCGPPMVFFSHICLHTFALERICLDMWNLSVVLAHFFYLTDQWSTPPRGLSSLLLMEHCPYFCMDQITHMWSTQNPPKSIRTKICPRIWLNAH